MEPTFPSEYDDDVIETSLYRVDLTRPDSMSPQEWILLCAKAAKGIDADIDACKRRMDELRQRVFKKQQSADKLRQRIKETFLMHRLHGSVKDGERCVYITAGKPRIQVLDLERIPQEYVKVEKSPMIRELNDLLKTSGEVPDGCDVVIGEDSVVIRG